MVKSLTKVKFNLVCYFCVNRGKILHGFCVNRVSSQILQAVENKHVNEASVWHIPHAYFTINGMEKKIQWIRALNYNVDSLGFKFFL